MEKLKARVVDSWAGLAGKIEFAEREASFAQPAGVSLRILPDVRIEVAHAGVMRIEAGEQCGARWAAAGGVVELGEAQAGSGKFVDVGGWDFAAVAGEVGEPHVIDEDDDDVGPRGGGAAQGCVSERQSDEGPPSDVSGG